ncbi:MAG: ABC transporter ATP-binding protein [Chloroflexi bacterium]|nr:ABC transporter ATP-binding protein [Chloroflexota bacterium]
MEPVVLMQDITKHFPGVVANDRITFEVAAGEVHGLLGENGAGKTTLMRILSGLYHPDAGAIYLKGQEQQFVSPRDALAHGIGMVHQHFMLIPTLSVAENLILGAEPCKLGFLDRKAAVDLVMELSEKYGLAVNPKAMVRDISVGAQQRVEILKVLYRGAEIIILDEPTAVLTPQEVDDLYHIVDALRAAGHTIIFISHKLNEVLHFTNRVTVLRDGKVVGMRPTAETTAAELAYMMVGRNVAFEVNKNGQAPGEEILKVEDVYANDSRNLPALCGVSFNLRAGEIVGIAGVEGNGQTQLAEVLAGLRHVTKGKIYLAGQDITALSVAERFERGVAHIPEDRHRRGLVLDFSISENSILGFQDSPPFAHGLSIDYKQVDSFSHRLLSEFDVRAPDVSTLAGGLSGGNQQKLVLAREFARQPKFLIAAQPTRGLDVGATEFIHAPLLEARQRGAGILLLSLELSEVMQLSDRILVIYEGRIVAECDPAQVTEAQVGLMMTGGGKHYALDH